MKPRSNARQATRTTTRSTRSAPLEIVDRSTVAPAPAEPSDDAVATKRVSFAMKADGTFDVDSMRSSNKDALRAALSDPALSTALGIASTQDASDTRLLETITAGLFDGLSFVAVAFAKRAGYSDAQAAIAAFTDKEKDVLAAPTIAVANKYFPDLGGKYRDEIHLCLALVNVIGAKILLLRSGARIMPNGEIAIIPDDRSTVAPPRVVSIDQGEQRPS